MMNKILIVLVGPTAIGKTSLSISIAKKLNTESISADSRQFFKELNIGVAKPSVKQLSEVKHHFISTHSIHQDYNAGKYQDEALAVIREWEKTHGF